MRKIYKIEFCSSGWNELPFFLCCDLCLKNDKTFCIYSHTYGYSFIPTSLMSYSLNNIININNACVEMISRSLFCPVDHYYYYKLFTYNYIFYIKCRRNYDD
jgi:hypothetical protein